MHVVQQLATRPTKVLSSSEERRVAGIPQERMTMQTAVPDTLLELTSATG